MSQLKKTPSYKTIYVFSFAGVNYSFSFTEIAIP